MWPRLLIESRSGALASSDPFALRNPAAANAVFIFTKDRKHRRLEDDEWAWLVIALVDAVALAAIGGLYCWLAMGSA